jgi:hypothetical protein
MRQTVMMALAFGWAAALPLSACEPATLDWTPPVTPIDEICAGSPISPTTVTVPPPQSTCETCPAEEVPWRTVWGVVGLRGIYDGPKIAPNGLEYHPNFSLDLDFNLWLWRSQGLYIFSDARFWGEKPEDGVTNERDGFLGTSKREFDLSGGVAWNYYGPWELRAFGYSDSSLNRGASEITPYGVIDGFGIENRYYFSSEYSKLGQTGFDVTRANFLSIGYYPSKNMIGNDGQSFTPGLLLRAYLTCDLWELPCYAYSDTQYIGEKGVEAKLLLFDLGLAARPFSRCRQCEFRLGAESTADFQARDIQSLWYASVRFIY